MFIAPVNDVDVVVPGFSASYVDSTTSVKSNSGFLSLLIFQAYKLVKLKGGNQQGPGARPLMRGVC